jgi:hypothetical protein
LRERTVPTPYATSQIRHASATLGPLIGCPRMRSLFALFATLFVSSSLSKEGYVETLVFPPEFEEMAKAHHCDPVLRALESDDPWETMPFDLRDIPPKRTVAGWCTRNSPTSKSTPTYILMISAPSPDNPLHYCPDEIHDIARIGSPSIDVLPMVPHDFVFLGTTERPTVLETRIVFGVRIRTPGSKPFYACMGGRWALYAPEHQ